VSKLDQRRATSEKFGKKKNGTEREETGKHENMTLFDPTRDPSKVKRKKRPSGGGESGKWAWSGEGSKKY